MAFLKLNDIKKEYTISKTSKQIVLNGLTAEFKRGELVAVLGESGCGKSTLINIVGGLDLDYTGSVEVEGKFMRDFDAKALDDYRKQRVGLVFQNYNLIPHMNLLGNVEIAMTIVGTDKRERESRAVDLLKLVGMGYYAERMPSELSGGQKQRVAIARALANNPSIILADEPTGALDKDSADSVLQILKRISDKGKLVVIVTHSHKIAAMCSRVIEIDDGVVIRDEKNYSYVSSEEKRDKYREIKPSNMKLREIWHLATSNVIQTKSRSALVSVGMSIGIIAVILILCLSTGLTNYVNTMLAAENSSSLVMMVQKEDGGDFSDDELEYINSLEGLVEAKETYFINEGVVYLYNNYRDTVNNIYPCYDICTPDVLYGTLPIDGEIIINSTLSASLTDDDISTLVGEDLTLIISATRYTYRISGIYLDASDTSDEASVFVTMNDIVPMLSEDADVNYLYVTASDAEYVVSIQNSFKLLGYSVIQVVLSASELIGYIDIATGVLTGVGAISLVVSAIMIFIVLYISVIERTKEIGIIRAIGGRKSDIRRIFSFEALILGTIGAVIACVSALLISLATNAITYASLGCNMISYNPLFYAIGFAACILISGISSIAPSLMASNLDPVEALRVE